MKFSIINLFTMFGLGFANNAVIFVDVQNCFENELPIFGASLNLDQVIDQLNYDITNISYIAVIKDSHTGKEINNRFNWINSTGHHPDEYDIIQYEDIGKKWWATSVSLEYAKYYSKYLLYQTKYPIITWPNHCISGTNGNDIDNRVKDFISNWEKSSNNSAIYLEKGLNLYSEQYGILPEARFPIVMRDKNIIHVINEIIHIVSNYKSINIIGDKFSHSTFYIENDINEILYNWLKFPLEKRPIITTNFNNSEKFVNINIKNTFNLIKEKIEKMFSDFFENIFKNEL